MNGQTVTQVLNPCPAGHDCAKLDYDDEFEAFLVQCLTDGCSWRVWGDTEAEAIAAWNTRTAHSGEGRSNGAGEDALRRAAAKFDDDVSQPRNLAVEIVDGIRGYTCEFAQSQREHEYWYDRVESLAARAALSAPQGKGRDNAAGFISVREHREGFPLNEAWLLYGHGDEEVIAQKIVCIDRKTLLGQALPADVVRLVIAAREIALNDWDGDSEEWAVARKELDQASEAFASRVPWDDEPDDAALAQPEAGGER